MSASRAARVLVSLLAFSTVGSACSWTLELDGYRSRAAEGAVGSLGVRDAGASTEDTRTDLDAGATSVGALADGEFRDYRFPRGATSFSIGAAEGIASGAAAADGVVLTSGSFPTARGGTVDVASDGSFTFTPAGAPGTFWGTDLLEYRLASRMLRARLTVYPDRLNLTELAASGGAGFGIGGPQSRDRVGNFRNSLAPAGDVNGDGLEDLVIGLPGETLLDDRGVEFGVGNGAYVLFGTRATSEVALVAPPPGAGFFVRGDRSADTLDSFGLAVAGAGDVDGDGFDDVVITSQTHGALGPLDPASKLPLTDPLGAVYVVFGKPDTIDIESSTLRAGQGRGFVILGSDEDLLIGLSASGAGDVNGDGRADVVVAVPVFGARETPNRSGIFVIFGKSDGGAVLLSDIARGQGGFALIEDTDNHAWGVSTAGVGDVNGDGLADIAFGGAYAPDATLPLTAGRVGVLLGQRSPAPLLSLADLEGNPSLGYLITGAAPGDTAALVQAAGDVDGDGLDDVLVAAPLAARDERGAPLPTSPPLEAPDAGLADAGEVAPGAAPHTSGIAYVVRGRRESANVSLSDIEQGVLAGSIIQGPAQGDGLGYSLSSSDIDADGYADIILSQQLSNGPTAAYVVFGKQGTAAVRLNPASPDEVLLVEGNDEELLCRAVASGADFNGDGLDDLLIGAALYAGAPQLAGGAYVAFGWDMRGTLRGRGPAMIGGASDNVFDLPAQPPILVRGGHGTDTLRAGSLTPVVDLRGRGRWESIEVVDVRGGGPHRVLLDEAAVRRIPENQPGFAFSLVRKLTVLGDAEDALELEATGFSSRGGSAGRAVYGKDAVYYGLEVSQEMTFDPGTSSP